MREAPKDLDRDEKQKQEKRGQVAGELWSK